MKLSIVIIVWHDRKVIEECLRSLYATTRKTEFEVIISDNGSDDGTVAFIREHYPQARIVANNGNLGFAKGNNTGIRVATGDYVLILNPDTIIHEGTLDQWIEFADQHPEAGAFGCRVLNPDGSYQHPARPFPTVWRYWIAALYLRKLAYLSNAFLSDTYTGWDGTTQRTVDWQSGCCVLCRGDLLRQLGGFDERFFYFFEEVDLCRRIWQSGHPVLFDPAVSITHLGSQATSKFPTKFELEKYRNRYRYFFKHYGMRGAQRCRTVSLAHLRIRQLGYGLIGLFHKTEAIKNRLEMYRTVIRWHSEIDPAKFIQNGQEPDVGYEPLAPPPKMIEEMPERPAKVA
jgi:GT2 family glycosyltransferase